MTKKRTALLAVALLLVCAGNARAQTAPGMEKAEELFKGGKIPEAGQAFAKLQKADPKNFQVALRQGQIALLGNHLKEAENWLKKALQLNSDSKPARKLLAEVYYRKDDFVRAAPLYRAVDMEPVAKKLESFGTRVPYQTSKKDFEVHVKFLQIDPLPMISARVNGAEANFLIDTGGAELILSADLAREIGAVGTGETKGVLAAGQASIGHSRVDSLVFEDLEVRNVPVQILDGRAFAAGAPGKKVDGVVGTVLLYHFVATLDYVSQELVLRPRSKQSLRLAQSRADREPTIFVPFWMAGDHFMLAWGRINSSQPLLWFVDTGLAGRGFVGTPETLKAAGIEIPNSPTGGGEGVVPRRAASFDADTLVLGDAVENKISGIRGQLSGIGEIRIDGIISHQFFKPYALTLDFQGMQLLLQRTPR